MKHFLRSLLYVNISFIKIFFFLNEHLFCRHLVLYVFSNDYCLAGVFLVNRSYIVMRIVYCRVILQCDIGYIAPSLCGGIMCLSVESLSTPALNSAFILNNSRNIKGKVFYFYWLISERMFVYCVFINTS